MVLGAELLALLVGKLNPQIHVLCHLTDFLPKEKAVKKIVKSTGKAGGPKWWQRMDDIVLVLLYIYLYWEVFVHE